jgi:GntR family transcriptional regulator, transcriptional repressor for pyruvate dehydrogenase complex
MALVADAVLKIRELIQSGDLQPGARLPAEAALAAQLGMSRNSMREAVKILAASRVLDVRQGDGTYVTSLSPDLLFEGLGAGVDMLQGRHLLDVLEVRRMLEPPATAAAAARVTDQDLQEVAEHLAKMAESAHDVEVMVQHDMAFHRRIIQSAGNEILTSVLDGLSSRTLRARVSRGVMVDGSSARTIAEHQMIFDALSDRDPVLAHAAALLHVNTSERGLRRLFHGSALAPLD